MKLGILCHDPIVASILRNEGWREAIAEENLPRLEAMLKTLDIPAELIREGDHLRIRVKWGNGSMGAYDPD